MQSVAELWNHSQELESKGDRDAARSIYEAILGREPHHVPARLRMSRLEQLADRYRASKSQALLAADAVTTQSATRNLAYVTARLLDFAEEQRVAAMILAADTSDPNVIRQSPALAQQLWLAAHYEDALRFMDAIAKHVSVHPLLTYTRANVLRFLGDMEGAQREYEASLRMSPDMADAHWALATHAKSHPPHARIPRIQESLRRAKDGSIEQAHLCYALFREFDAAGDIDEAWFSLTLGAHIMKRRLSFDSQREAGQLEGWLTMPMHTAPASDAEPTPVFVVGMPRTGTTVLDRILSNHSQVESLGERNDFSAAVSDASDSFFRSLSSAGERFLSKPVEYAMAGRLYLERVKRLARGTRFVIDKNPQNLFNVPLILRAVPNARVLCLQRDPMDACFSNLKELFQGDAYPYSYSVDDLADHCLRARAWMDHWAAVAPAAVRVVRYEDLATGPEKIVQTVLDFLGLESQAGLHDIRRNQTPVSTASSSQVREDIHVRGIGAWRRYERHLQPLMSRLGVR